MAVKKAGFEGQIFYGAAGGTAATQLTNVTDVSYDFATEKGETTVRGAGADVPIKSQRVVCREGKLTFTMLFKSDDASLAALLAASFAGTPVAIRTKSYSSGTGFDGDVILEHSHGKPLKGMQTVEFSCEVNDDLRTASFNV